MQTEEISFIEMNPSHLVMCTQAFQRCLKTCFPTFSQEVQRNYLDQWNLSRFQQTSEHGCIVMALHHNQVIGMVVGSAPEAGVATIFWLMVEPKWQGQGIGRELLEKAFLAYKKQDCHKIKLTAPTLEAKDYYLKKGFQQEGFHPEHWWKMDFWSLAKHL